MVDYLSAKRNGFTLIEVLVGSFLVLIVLLGFFYSYQLALKVTEHNKNKITATEIAKSEIEKIRNLPYGSVGLINGFPSGIVEKESTITINNLEYKITRRIDYIVDPADGTASPDDNCPNDYKKVEISVSWSGFSPGLVRLTTDISPQTLAQECSETGGILSVSVFNAKGEMVPSPLIEVKDPTTGDDIKTAIPDSGRYLFSLPIGTYEVDVSKDGYNSDKTYSLDEIATPAKPNPNVLENKVTEISFAIDKLSSFSIDTLSSWGSDYFFDSFSDESKISSQSNLIISDGKVILSGGSGNYEDRGYLISIPIEPTNLLEWDKLSFNDSEPSGTEIVYHLLYYNGDNWEFIPDSDLPGNSDGFTSSPVDLSSLDINNYPKLEIKGVFSTNDRGVTPTLSSWQVSWKTSQATAISNVSFHIQGEKIIGTDSSESPVYKYSQDYTSDSSGHINIQNLEWDNYTFSSNDSNLDLVATNPTPQPISLAPDTKTSLSLYFKSQNSLLVTIEDADSGDPVFGASVRLYNSNSSYDTTQKTDEKGQTYFIPLTAGNYTLEVTADGYESKSISVSVSGNKNEIISLTRIE